MKIVDNSSETASPLGGVGSIVMRTQSTATQVNTIRRQPWTSLRTCGEVPTQRASGIAHGQVEGHKHGGLSTTAGVVGGSRLGRGGVCEDRRSARIGHRQRCRAEVRAVIVARKRGNARGAKGGRKWNCGAKRIPSEECYRLPTGLERHGLSASGADIVAVVCQEPRSPNRRSKLEWVTASWYPGRSARTDLAKP